MPKVLCRLVNASELISGVRFVKHKDGMISEEISDERAEEFCEIKGYEIAETPLTKAQQQKAAKEAADKAEAEKQEKEAADKAAAEAKGKGDANGKPGTQAGSATPGGSAGA